MAATLIGFTGIASRAQTPGESLLLFPQWEPVFTLRTGGGYKDNVFLSHSRPQASAFISGGGDVMVLRAAPTGPQFNFFASADVIHFLSTTSSHDEYTAFAQAQAQQDFGPALKASLAAEYFYQDLFADVAFLDESSSGTNVAVRPAAVRSHTLALRPGAQLTLPRDFSISLETPVTREYQEAPLDDQWNVGFKAALTRSYGHDSRLSLSYEPTWRFYDHDPALTSSGLAITNSHRRRFLQETLLTWRHYWRKCRGLRRLCASVSACANPIPLRPLARVCRKPVSPVSLRESAFRSRSVQTPANGMDRGRPGGTETRTASQTRNWL
jgi:hypothetical protein